jgi:class 3 adenylate cyclase
MQYTFGSKGKARFLAAFLLGVVAISCAVFVQRSIDSRRFGDSASVDLSGEWEFHNGVLENAESDFSVTVEVPKPLPFQLKQNLKSEFWYRKKFSVNAQSGMALSLGSIKGEHEVFWNGKFLGAGGKTGLAFYRVPDSFLRDKTVSLTVKVRQSNALFPGIVHLNQILFGSVKNLEKHLDYYYFDTGVKPLLPATLKLALFFLFIGFFAAVPYKREFLSFSIFAALAAVASAFYSRFLPGYDEFEFKSGIIFLFFVLSLGTVPALAADFLRLPAFRRAAVRIYGASLAIIFITASLLVEGPGEKLTVFRMANQWMPVLALVPVIVLCIFSASLLDPVLVHRKIQIFVFSFFLFAGLVSWGSGASAFMKFQLFQVQEYLDLVVFAGLASAIALDFRQTSARSERASSVVPKWFSGFLASGLDRVNLELPLIAMAVDTVGYTKHLVGLSAEKKEHFHAAMRASLNQLTEKYGAQKISERGDGGIFAWDLPLSEREREHIFNSVLEASRSLSATAEAGTVIFRVGLACGVVRGEMKGGDISFLGEALNCAARLETMAAPGSALVDESLVSEIPDGQLEKRWVEAELKGVVYRAKLLLTVAS